MTSTAIALKTHDGVLEDVDFSPAAHDLAIPKLDGRKAMKLDLRSFGSGTLDRTSENDLALLEAMRLGRFQRAIERRQVFPG